MTKTLSKKFAFFIVIVILIMTLFVVQTTASYMLYLYQMGMPVYSSVFLSAVGSDLIGMNLHGIFPPIFFVIFVVLGVAFLLVQFWNI